MQDRVPQHRLIQTVRRLVETCTTQAMEEAWGDSMSNSEPCVFQRQNSWIRGGKGASEARSAPCHSRCGPWTCLSWERGRNADAHPSLRPSESEPTFEGDPRAFLWSAQFGEHRFSSFQARRPPQPVPGDVTLLLQDSAPQSTRPPSGPQRVQISLEWDPGVLVILLLVGEGRRACPARLL